MPPRDDDDDGFVRSKATPAPARTTPVIPRTGVIVPASAATGVQARKGSTAVVDVRRGESPDRVFAHPDHITVTP